MKETMSRTKEIRIQSMTAAVLVNSAAFDDNQGEIAPEIRQEYTELVKRAIGFNEERGDQITVNFSKFSEIPELDGEVAQPIPWDQIHQVLKNISLGLAGLVCLLLGIMAIRKIAPLNQPPLHSVQRETQVEQLRDLIKENPEVFSQIIAAWSRSTPDSDSLESPSPETAARRAA